MKENLKYYSNRRWKPYTCFVHVRIPYMHNTYTISSCIFKKLFKKISYFLQELELELE